MWDTVATLCQAYPAVTPKEALAMRADLALVLLMTRAKLDREQVRAMKAGMQDTGGGGSSVRIRKPEDLLPYMRKKL